MSRRADPHPASATAAEPLTTTAPFRCAPRHLAFHTVAGLMAWVNTTYGSYSAAPILRLGWVFHQPQLDRLGLAFGVNLTWGD